MFWLSGNTIGFSKGNNMITFVQFVTASDLFFGLLMAFSNLLFLFLFWSLLFGGFKSNEEHFLFVTDNRGLTCISFPWNSFWFWCISWILGSVNSNPIKTCSRACPTTKVKIMLYQQRSFKTQIKLFW